MSQRKFTWIGMTLGSLVVGAIPTLWGESLFSFVGLIFNSLGAIAGIWFGYKIGKNF